MTSQEKNKRRAKRQDRLFNTRLVARTIKKLFGDEEVSTGHIPLKDSSKSQHRRVVEQRVISGRLNMDNYRKVGH